MKKRDRNISKVFQSIKCFLNNIKNTKMSFISFFAIVFGSISLLISGATNSNTNIYTSATYVSEILQNNENNDHLALVVEQKENGIVPDTATELRSLYGAFGNRESNYAGTINASKDKDLTFADFEQDNRLSFVYVQSGVQVSNRTNDDGIVHHRMEFYPLELMFDLYNNDPHHFYSFLYLSTSQARKIIDLNYPGLFDAKTPIDDLLKEESFIQKCKKIIGTGVNIKFSNSVKTFQITNIFYEKDYFYDIVHNTIGEFIVGYNQYPEGYQKQATYFLNKYEYQSKFYMSYIKERYNKADCEFNATSVGINTEIENDMVFSFLKEGNNVVSSIFLVLAILSYLSGIFLMIRFKLFNYSYLLYLCIALLAPYMIGFLLWKITKKIIFFSPSFTVSFLTSLLVMSLFLICYSLILIWGKRKEMHD